MKIKRVAEIKFFEDKATGLKSAAVSNIGPDGFYDAYPTAPAQKRSAFVVALFTSEPDGSTVMQSVPV